MNTQNFSSIQPLRGLSQDGNSQRTIEQLRADKSELLAKFRATRADGDNDAIIEQLNAIENQISLQQRAELLARVNREQAAKRTEAAKVWECEQPETDITTNSREFHAVKVKKYPKLAALQYARATFKDGKMLELETGREKFRMFSVKYEYGKPDTYTRPASFEAFLELNNIMLEDMTTEQFEAIVEANKAINAEFQAAATKFSNQKSELNMHDLSAWGLFSQHNAGHNYEYSVNR